MELVRTVLAYCRAGGIDAERAKAVGGKPPTPVSNMALVTGLLEAEPVFVLRGLDPFAHEALARYADAVSTVAMPHQLEALRKQLDAFDMYQQGHMDLARQARGEGVVP